MKYNRRVKYLIYIPDKNDYYKHEEFDITVMFETIKEAEAINNSKLNSSGIIKTINYISC